MALREAKVELEDSLARVRESNENCHVAFTGVWNVVANMDRGNTAVLTDKYKRDRVQPLFDALTTHVLQTGGCLRAQRKLAAAREAAGKAGA